MSPKEYRALPAYVRDRKTKIITLKNGVTIHIWSPHFNSFQADVTYKRAGQTKKISSGLYFGSIRGLVRLAHSLKAISYHVRAIERMNCLSNFRCGLDTEDVIDALRYSLSSMGHLSIDGNPPLLEEKWFRPQFIIPREYAAKISFSRPEPLAVSSRGTPSYEPESLLKRLKREWFKTGGIAPKKMNIPSRPFLQPGESLLVIEQQRRLMRETEERIFRSIALSTKDLHGTEIKKKPKLKIGDNIQYVGTKYEVLGIGKHNYHLEDKRGECLLPISIIDSEAIFGVTLMRPYEYVTCVEDVNHTELENLRNGIYNEHRN